MEKPTAKPGNTICVTNVENIYHGMKFVVKEPPPYFAFVSAIQVTYVTLPDGNYGYFFSRDYEIVSQESKTDTDASLKRQLDNNLRSIFG